MVSRRWLSRNANNPLTHCYFGSFRPKEESKTPWGPQHPVMPIQQIRTDVKARFCLDKTAAVEANKGLWLYNETSLRENGDRFCVFLENLFNFAVNGLKCCFCIQFHFLCSYTCFFSPSCDQQCKNGFAHVCFYISDGFNLFKSYDILATLF